MSKINLVQKGNDNELILFRAVSIEELNDVILNGIRNISGGYETVKLFAVSHRDAVAYGNINKHFDNRPYVVIKVAIEVEIFEESELIETDGMDAISIEEKHLPLLKFISEV